MKFLATIRFDPSDDHVFEIAAAPGEWAIPGGFTFAHLPRDALVGKVRQAFANGFISLVSHGHSTFASVVEISDAELSTLVEGLADHLALSYGAPDRAAAMQAARGELDFVVELCRDADINTVFSLRRSYNEAEEIHEEFRTIVPADGANQVRAHTRVWEIVDDDPVLRGGAAK